MDVQLIVIFLIIISGFLFSNSKSYTDNTDAFRKKYIIFISLILILQSALRNLAVGPDTFQYSEMFDEDTSLSWLDVFRNFNDVYIDKTGRDAGYPLFEKIFYLFSTEYRVFLFFIAILFFSAFGQFLYKNTTSIFSAIFSFVLYQALFYSFFSITGIRQTIATAITFWCFELIKKKKFLPYLLLILVASTIHKSVLLFLPFYFIANLDKSKLIYSISFILFPIMMFVKEYVALALAAASSVENYMNYAQKVAEAGTPTFTALMFLIMLFGWFFMNKTLEKFPDSFRFFNAMAFAFVLTPLTWVDPNLMRVVQYYSVFMLIFIPTIIESIDYKGKTLRNLVYVAMIAILILLIIKTGGEYKFLWQDMQLGENYD